MSRKSVLGRGLAVAGIAGAAVVPLLSFPPPVSAAVDNGLSNSYYSKASAELVRVDAAKLGQTLAASGLVVAPASTTVNSADLPRSTARAANARVIGPNGAVDREAVSASQTAPADHPTATVGGVGTVAAAPVITGGPATATAQARWVGDGQCVTNGVLSSAQSVVADAALLPNSPAGTVLTLSNGSDPAGGAVSATSTQLVKNRTSNTYAVRTTSSTQLTAISLLNRAVTVEVLAAPKVTAIASGSLESSSVEVTQPVLRVNGMLLASGQTITRSVSAGSLPKVLPDSVPVPAVPNAGPTSGPGTGVVPTPPAAVPTSQPLPSGPDTSGPVLVLTAGTVTAEPAGRGTISRGSGDLLRVQLLASAAGATLLDFTVGHVEAFSAAPSGGVICGPDAVPPAPTLDPLRTAAADVSRPIVQAGETFDYTVAVPNDGNQDFSDVVVDDSISGSPALQLVAISPEPAFSTQSTYRFELGTMTPGTLTNLRLTFRVPEDADPGTQYANTAVITGKYEGRSVTKTVTAQTTVGTPDGVAPSSSSRESRLVACESCGGTSTASWAAALAMILVGGLSLRASGRVIFGS